MKTKPLSAWMEIPFVATSGQVRLSVVSKRPWAYRLWNEVKKSLVNEGHLNFLTDLALNACGRWRLDINLEGLSLKPRIKRLAKCIEINLLPERRELAG